MGRQHMTGCRGRDLRHDQRTGDLCCRCLGVQALAHRNGSEFSVGTMEIGTKAQAITQMMLPSFFASQSFRHSGAS
jgi:hypothetical protein